MAKNEVVIRILGDAKGLTGALDSAGGALGKIGPMAATAGAAVAAGIAVGVAKAGKELYNLGASFDEQFDKIRVGTGKTGDALEGLQGDFKKVLKTTATDFDTAGDAVTTLNQRLELTGEPLAKLSKQFIDFSTLTGTDVKGNIEKLTRVFGDWGVGARDQSMNLDKVFRATQAAGVGVDQLTERVVAFGAPLRGLGFEFGDSIALLSKWEKEGVNVELVMGAMKKAFGSFAKEGANAPKAFQAFLAEVQKAPTLSAAATIAIDRLGVKAGPDFAAAVKEGRFEYDELLRTINVGEDSVASATLATEDFSEKWQRFKNTVLVGLEPLATGAFDGINGGMERMGGFLAQNVMPRLQQFGTYFKTTVLPLLLTARDNAREFIVEGLDKLRQAISDNEPQLMRMRAWLEDVARFITERLLPVFVELSGRGIGGMIEALGVMIDWIAKGVDAIVWMTNSAIDQINKLIQGANLIKPGADIKPISKLAATPPKTSGGGSFFVGGVALASGGVVKASAGGTLALLGEGGHDEAVIPLDGRHGVGSSLVFNNYAPIGDRATADWLLQQIQALLARGARIGDGRGRFVQMGAGV